eukprot:364630-Chlamydomonas_euryale.AAC.25
MHAPHAADGDMPLPCHAARPTYHANGGEGEPRRGACVRAGTRAAWLSPDVGTHLRAAMLRERAPAAGNHVAVVAAGSGMGSRVDCPGR